MKRDMPHDPFKPTWQHLSSQLETLAEEVDRARGELSVDEAIQDPFSLPDKQPEYDAVLGLFRWPETDSVRAGEIELFAGMDGLIGDAEAAVQDRSVPATLGTLARLRKVWRRLTLAEGGSLIELPSDGGIASYDALAEDGVSLADLSYDTSLDSIGFPLGTMDNVWEDVQNSLQNLQISSPVEILKAPPLQLEIPKLVLSVQEALLERVRSNPASIFSIQPRAFEELIAELFNASGFAVELTKQTRDGGRDIVAIGSCMGIRSRYLIECKRYAPERKVSVGVVQRLYGVKVAEGANKAILATTSGFTRDAKTFAHQHLWDLDLRAHDDIMSWIRDYKRTSLPL